MSIDNDFVWSDPILSRDRKPPKTSRRYDPLKICFFGNQGNNAFKYCKFLRAQGHEGELWYFPNQDGIRSYPEAVDPKLKDNYPNWIKSFSSLDNIDQIQREVEENFDIVFVASSVLTTVARHFDTDKIPMVIFFLGPSVAGVFSKSKKVIANKQEALRKALTFVCASQYDFYGINKVDGLGKARIFLQPEDVFSNRNSFSRNYYSDLRKKYDQYDRTILWMSRTELDPANLGYKAPERFVEAVNQYLVNNPDANIRVVYGKHGSASDQLLDRMQSLPIGKVVDIVDHLPHHELMSYLALPNAIVLDDFEYALSTSGMMREAISVGGVMIRRLDSLELSYAFGPNCPVLDATTVEEIYEHLAYLIPLSFEDFQEERKRTALWAEEYLHWENTIHKIEDILWNTVMVHRNLGRDNALVEEHVDWDM